MRLIDACALQEEYKARHSGKRLLLIDVAPTVDAVPVGRCKEGKWWHDWNGECYGNGNMGYGVGRKADDFCSWGERKDV